MKLAQHQKERRMPVVQVDAIDFAEQAESMAFGHRCTETGVLRPIFLEGTLGRIVAVDHARAGGRITHNKPGAIEHEVLDFWMGCLCFDNVQRYHFPQAAEREFVCVNQSNAAHHAKKAMGRIDHRDAAVWVGEFPRGWP
jgi:hypothetical protein